MNLKVRSYDSEVHKYLREYEASKEQLIDYEKARADAEMKIAEANTAKQKAEKEATTEKAEKQKIVTRAFTCTKDRLIRSIVSNDCSMRRNRCTKTRWRTRKVEATEVKMALFAEKVEATEAKMALFGQVCERYMYFI